MTITGKVVYKNLGPGCWGIESSEGEYRPVNFPEQLKQEGATVTVKAREVEEFASVFMWGTAVHITSFSTLTP